MVTLALDRDALAQVRFTTSPLWEMGLSALVLRKRNPGPVHAAWVRTVHATVDPLVVSKMTALTSGDSFVADFLTPSGSSLPTDGFTSELDYLHSLDDELLRRDLAALEATQRHSPSPGAAWVRGLSALPHTQLLRELDGVLTAYWSAAIQPRWSRYLRLVDADSLLHARRFARGGVSMMLNGLHPRVRLTEGELHIAGACEATLEKADASDGALLVPSAFAWPDVHVQPNAPYQPAIAYGVRGLATLWLATQDPSDHLSQLLGTGRARVLATLVMPSTTGEIAHELSLAPSTVSAHLHALTASGLAENNREGRAVVYRLTELGRSLIGVD